MSGAHNIYMLATVADALGAELCEQVAFVGGCTTTLLITDEYRREAVRFTDDVDLVVQLTGYAQWPKLMERLRQKGFMESPLDDVNCRMRLGELKVDFMPDSAQILGYSNRWFHDGFSHAQQYLLPSGTSIRLFTAPYFLGTKLEAYYGRGTSDPLMSKDLEDILNLVDGREELLQEVASSPKELRDYLTEKFGPLLNHGDFAYLVQDAVRGDFEREKIIWERLHQLAEASR